jgi:putative ABC transport system permease protein
MLNETAVRFLSLEKPVGTKFGGYGFEIVGVVRDFHVQSLRMNINPLLIGLNAQEIYPYFSMAIRYLPGNGLKALARSKQLISKIFYDYNSTYDYQEDRIMRLYDKEKKIEEIISFATFLILIVSVTGMFALSLYETERRLKEIGIRKINGAGVNDIMMLLSKEFIQYVIIAFLLGGPIAFYFMVKWLEGFKYKTAISWWIFALTGASAILITLCTISYQTIRTARKNPVEILRYE